MEFAIFNIRKNGVPAWSHLKGNGYRSNNSADSDKKCMQCKIIYSGYLPFCPKCKSPLYEKANDPAAKNRGETWVCEKCWARNALTALSCKGCGAYK